MEWKTFDYKSKKQGKKGEILNKDIYIDVGFVVEEDSSPLRKARSVRYV